MIDRLVDAHHHLTALSQRSYPWLERTGPFPYHGDDTPLRRDYDVADYLRDVDGLPLIASVHVENGAADARAESVWIDGVVRQHGIPSAQVAFVDLSRPDAVGELEFHASVPSVRGIRHILNWHDDPHYSHTDRPGISREPAWRRAFARLAPLGLRFDLQVFPGQLDEAAELATDHPGTTIVLDHAGMPFDRSPDALARWRAGLVELARRPNVSVKVSAFGTTDHAWTVASLREVVLPVIDVFGPGRTMWGSNFPVDGLYSSYRALVEAYDEITSGLDAAERDAVFAATALRVYGMGSPIQ